MVQLCKRVAEAPRFQNFVTAVIVFAGIVVGFETYGELAARYHGVLGVLDKIILGIFVAEIAIKLVAEGSRPWNYFRDPWNVFDFTIVAAAFMPFAAQYATVLRLLRLLRVLRLLRALPRLQLLVGALLKSIPSMAYVSLLMFLLFYVYACAAVFLWGANDPIHFSDLQTSLLSLFRVVTLEDWTDLMYINMYGCESYGYGGNEALCTASSGSPVGSALFFVSFVLLGTMIVLNLFIGVILGGMNEAQQEQRTEAPAAEPTMATRLASVADRMAALQQELADLQRLAAK